MYCRNSFSPTRKKEDEKEKNEEAETGKEEEQVEERSNAAGERACAPSSLEFRANGSPPQRCSSLARAPLFFTVIAVNGLLSRRTACAGGMSNLSGREISATRRYRGSRCREDDCKVCRQVSRLSRVIRSYPPRLRGVTGG